MDNNKFKWFVELLLGNRLILRSSSDYSNLLTSLALVAKRISNTVVVEFHSLLEFNANSNWGSSSQIQNLINSIFTFVVINIRRTISRSATASNRLNDTLLRLRPL